MLQLKTHRCKASVGLILSISLGQTGVPAAPTTQGGSIHAKRESLDL